MKVTLLILVVSSVTANITPVVPLENKESDFVYPRHVSFNYEISKRRGIDLQAETDMQHVKILSHPASNKYLLYTRRNQQQPQELFLNNDFSVQSSNFNPEVPIIAVVHGWTQDHTSDVNTVLRNAFLAKSDVNVIVLDWSWLSKLDYVSAAYGLPAAGRALGQFLNFLIASTAASYDNIHLIGFSLGCHLVANAGKEMGSRAARITALDPSAPQWHSYNNRLSPTDAVYVEAIHTDGGYLYGSLGVGTTIAQVSWFPNGGLTQPGCWTNVCNHDRAWELFAASVTYNHLIGRQCSNNLQISLNMCQGEQLPMGNDDLRKRGSGIFRVNTSSRYPF